MYLNQAACCALASQAVLNFKHMISAASSLDANVCQLNMCEHCLQLIAAFATACQ